MKGRKPVAGAQRRGGADDKMLVKIANPTEATIAGMRSVPIPMAVAESPARMELWRQVVGDGSAYKPEDSALIALFVTWMDAANQITHAMTNDEGGVLLTVDGKPSPYMKQLDLATKNVLKLSDQLGCTPLARARLGLTEAAKNNLNVTIADRISRAMERSK